MAGLRPALAYSAAMNCTATSDPVASDMRPSSGSDARNVRSARSSRTWIASKPGATRASIALAEAAATAETARISAGRGFIFAATIDQLSELHLHAWSIPCVENLIARQVPLASTKDERSHGRTGALDPLTGDQ